MCLILGSSQNFSSELYHFKLVVFKMTTYVAFLMLKFHFLKFEVLFFLNVCILQYDNYQNNRVTKTSKQDRKGA